MEQAHEIGFRNAAETDSELIYSIKKSAFAPYVKTQYGGWNETDQREYHRRHFQAEHYRIILMEGSIAGFIAVVANPTQLVIQQLMICPEFHSRGIGTQCMDVIKEEARLSGAAVCLQVLKINPRALNFYQHAGFSIVAVTQTHYQLRLSC